MPLFFKLDNHAHAMQIQDAKYTNFKMF